MQCRENGFPSLDCCSIRLAPEYQRQGRGNNSRCHQEGCTSAGPGIPFGIPDSGDNDCPHHKSLTESSDVGLDNELCCLASVLSVPKPRHSRQAQRELQIELALHASSDAPCLSFR